jgi:TatA/E family protein of Tat protein translocase
MEIFGVGPAEMLVILVVALIVFGPGKLPEIGAALGRAIGDFRRASREFTAGLGDTVAEVRGEFEETLGSTRADLQDATSIVQKEAKALSTDLREAASTVQQEARALSSGVSAQPGAWAPTSRKSEPVLDEAEARWLQLGWAQEDDGAGAR